MLKGKPGKTGNWLPSQVLYGMDTSDSDPEKWQTFGSIHEEHVETAKHASAKQGAPGAPPGSQAKP